MEKLKEYLKDYKWTVAIMAVIIVICLIIAFRFDANNKEKEIEEQPSTPPVVYTTEDDMYMDEMYNDMYDMLGEQEN